MYKDDALRLYLTAFPEDDSDFAEDFLDRFFEKACRYIIKDGRLVSMLFLLDATLNIGNREVGGKYLYAAATLPEYRGQGLMAELIEAAKKETAEKGEFLLTKPAGDSLFTFYGRFGFKTAVCLKDSLYKLENDTAPLSVLTVEEYLKNKKILYQNAPYITLCDIGYAYSGLTLFGNENTLAAVDLSENPPHIKEFISKEKRGKDALLCAISKTEAVFREEGETPFAMIIFDQPLKGLGFSLALD